MTKQQLWEIELYEGVSRRLHDLITADTFEIATETAQAIATARGWHVESIKRSPWSLVE